MHFVKDDMDKSLWQKLRLGSEDALYELHEKYYLLLVSYGKKEKVDIDAIKSGINQLFFSLWKSRDNLSEVNNTTAYLITSFRRILMRQNLSVNAEAIDNVTETDISFQLPYDEEWIARQEQEHKRLNVQNAINRLPKRQKQIIILRYFEEHSIEEIAEKTGVSVRTVYNTLHRAINSLRHELGKTPKTINTAYHKKKFSLGSFFSMFF